VSNMVGGVAGARRQQRVYETIYDLAQKMGEHTHELPDTNDEYVRSEDFEELFEQTLRRVADERSEEKRKVYASFLADAIMQPWQDYDEQLGFVRSLEQLQPAHLSIIRAYAREEAPPNNAMMGSIIGTLRRRLLDSMDEARIQQLVSDLVGMRILIEHTLGVNMTSDGAERTASRISPYGSRFTRYLQAE